MSKPIVLIGARVGVTDASTSDYPRPRRTGLTMTGVLTGFTTEERTWPGEGIDAVAEVHGDDGKRYECDPANVTLLAPRSARVKPR